jgi:hypothetical protein
MGKNRFFLQLVFCFSAVLIFISSAFIFIGRRYKDFPGSIRVKHINDIASYHVASPLSITKISSIQLPN